MRRSRVRLDARAGFTFVELCVVILCIAVLVGLLLPMTRSSREASRRMQCQNNIKQLGLALHNYEAAHRYFPAAVGGTGVGATDYDGNANRLSGFVALLPYLEQNELFEQISKPMDSGKVKSYPAMGPAPWVLEYEPWQKSLPVLLCPSYEAFDNQSGSRQYAFCIGDVTNDLHSPKSQRGPFMAGQNTTLDSIVDKSNTIALAEIGRYLNIAVSQPTSILRSPTECWNAFAEPKAGSEYQGHVERSEFARGKLWADGAAGHGLFQTILPPNAPSCSVGDEHSDGLFSAGGYHSGGINVAMVDGSVQFVSENIDTGDLSAGPPILTSAEAAQPLSPYGVWGAMGVARMDAAKSKSQATLP